MRSLRGKRVLITGAANGLGRCLADRFAEEGCILVLTDVDKTALDKTARELQAQAVDVKTYVVDVSRQKSVEKMAAEVVDSLGGIDVLINNAGIGILGELVETPIETWKKLMAIDFWGALYHVYAFIPSMIQAGEGHIVNISSGQAFYRMPTWGAYSIVKLALGAFSELLRLETRKLGLKVTTVYPFMIKTKGFYRDFKPETFGAKLSLRIQPFFSMSPERVARIILKAVKKNKPVEMTSVLNTFGFYSRLLPSVSDFFSAATFKLLDKHRDEIRNKQSV